MAFFDNYLYEKFWLQFSIRNVNKQKFRKVRKVTKSKMWNKKLKSVNLLSKNQLHQYKMAVLHRALCTWFICLIFLILLVLRLDERTRWSWFIVFIPMWLYDSILLLYLTFNLVRHCKRPHNRNFKSMRRKIW